MTVRRDIRQLADKGFVHSNHGGVSAVVNAVAGPAFGGTDFQIRGQTQILAKRAIARAAANRIEPGAIVALDAGTTVYEIVNHLPEDARLTVITHSLPVMTAFSSRPSVEVIGLGGVLHTETQAFAGPSVVAALDNVRVSTLFLAASAVRGGIMFCGNPYDAETKRALIAAADEVVLLVDSSKFVLPALFAVAPCSDVGTVIVDAGIDDAEREQLVTAGADVEVAEVELSSQNV
jgi:DeoR family fructose operon transcriptional repressor